MQTIGSNDTGDGVQGFSGSPNHSGVVGQNNAGGFGVLGEAAGPNSAVAGINAKTGPGITGRSDSESDGNDGVQGISNSAQHSGVFGENLKDGVGVFGHAKGKNAAVVGTNEGEGAGVFAISTGGPGLQAESNKNNAPALSGIAHGTGAGVFAKSESGPAAFFDGDVVYTGALRGKLVSVPDDGARGVVKAIFHVLEVLVPVVAGGNPIVIAALSAAAMVLQDI